MGRIELILTAIALAADAFAVSVCKGLSVRKMKPIHALWCGLYFGGFQALMPLLGYMLGRVFEKYVMKPAPLIACVMLVAIGINMIREACSQNGERVNASFSPKAMLPLAIATSIDALVVGIGMGILRGTNIAFAVSSIGIITLLLSAVGVYIGHLFGAKYKSKAELVGGMVLILIGLKTLIFDFLIPLFK